MKKTATTMIGLCWATALILTGCGGGSDGGAPSPSAAETKTYTIGGSITGYTGSGLVLQNNGTDDLTITSNSASFTFTTEVADGDGYLVSVKVQPIGVDPLQVCQVVSESGTVAGAAVDIVEVNCANSSWQTLAHINTLPNFSDFTPAGQSVLYNMDNRLGTMQRFSFPTDLEPLGVFADLTPSVNEFYNYIGLAWVGDKLYFADTASIYAYDIGDDSWTTPVDGTLTFSHQMAQTTADDSGFIYSVGYGNAQAQLLKLNTADSSFVYFQAPSDVTTEEPRVAWDSESARLYLADYGNPNGFYAFNPADESFTSLTSLPDSAGMSDAFCSDRRGHIFTVNSMCNTATEVWMYTAATDSWASFPALPFAHGCNASCTVTADGWLYFGDDEGDGTDNFARIRIF